MPARARDDSGRQHLFALGEHRTASAHGNAQLVQELGVDLVDRALPVGVYGRGELRQDGAKTIDRRDARVERHRRRPVEAGEIDVGGNHCERHRVTWPVHEPDSFELAVHTPRVPFEPQLRFDFEHPTPAIRRMAMVDIEIIDKAESDHRFAPPIGPRQRGAHRAHADNGAQRSHVDDRSDARAKRPGRKIVAEARHGPHDDFGGHDVRSGQPQGSPLSLHEFEAQPSAMKAAVEGVEDGPREGVGLATLEAHRVDLAEDLGEPGLGGREGRDLIHVARKLVRNAHTGSMTVEIERKFVLAAIPPAHMLGDGTSIRQGYLAEEGEVEVRLRMTDDACVLTVKAGRGRERTEVEVAVSPSDAQALWPHTANRRIEKVRHRLMLDDHAGLVAEVDVYGGALTGLCAAEVEFASLRAADAFVPPAWLGREVSGERGWSNAALARHGSPA